MNHRDDRPLTVVDEPPFDPRYDDAPPDDPGPNRAGRGGRPATADRAAEQAVLVALIHDPGAHDTLAAELDSADFYWPEHARIWDAWHHLHQADAVPPDAVTLNAHLVQHQDVHAVRALTALHGLNAHPGLHAQHARIVRDTAKLRAVDEVATGLRDLVSKARVDQVDHYLGEALQRLDETVMRFGNTTGGNTSWAPHNLDPVLAGHEIDPPPALLARADGVFLLYAGAVHTISGEPGSGKTWLTLLAALQVLAADGIVTMIDFEDRASRVIGRLLALGAHPDAIRERFRYIRPNTGLDHTSRTDLDHATTGSALVILDGVTEAMTMHGHDLNSNADVAKFYDLLPRHIADTTGAAVVMIDHVVKDGEKQGRWALGGQHKLAGIDGVAYLVKAIEKFGRGKIGHARLIVSKDRPGYVEEIALGMTVAELYLDARDVNVLRADLRAPAAAPTDESGNMRPTHLMERLSRYVEGNPGLGKRDLLDGRIQGKTTYLKRAIDRLVQEGYIEVTTGPNRQHIHRSLTPFREDENAMHTNTGWADQEPLR